MVRVLYRIDGSYLSKTARQNRRGPWVHEGPQPIFRPQEEARLSEEEPRGPDLTVGRNFVSVLLRCGARVRRGRVSRARKGGREPKRGLDRALPSHLPILQTHRGYRRIEAGDRNYLPWREP